MKNKIIVIFILGFTLVFPFSNSKQFNDAFVMVAQKANPAVVSIISEKKIKNDPHGFYSPFGNQFYDHDFTNQTLGSGVILDSKEGYIVTNNHVIENSNDIKVVLYDKTELDAKIIGVDPPSDLAVIQVNSKNLDQIDFGTSSDLQVGEWIIAIGSPFGLHLNHTVTAGIVSAVGRSDVISKMNFENFIQHDAAINPGNSGGALLNLDGKLIGINTAIATSGFSRANAGVGFAIPIDQVIRVTEDLIQIGKVSRGWLGVSIQDINKNMASALKLESQHGVIISDVFYNSPAENGGIKIHDIVININNKNIHTASDLKNIISNGRPNDIIDIKVFRDSKIRNLSVKLGERPKQEDLLSGNFMNNQFDLLGFIVDDYEQGVVIIDIKKGSNSHKQNINKGDVIIGIGNNEITSRYDYNNLISQYVIGDIIMLRIIRNGNARYLAFEIS